MNVYCFQGDHEYFDYREREYIERESKKREYWEYLESFFLRNYREYFEEVKRDYKVRVKSENVPRISWF